MAKLFLMVITYGPAIAAGVGAISPFWLLLSVGSTWAYSIYDMNAMLESDGEPGFKEMGANTFMRTNSAITIATVIRLIPVAVVFGISYLFR